MSFIGRREVDMNVAVHSITHFRNRSAAQSAFGRSFYGSLLALGAGVALLCGNGAALGGPCAIQIVQFERQIADNTPHPLSGPILPQSRDAQLHHQPTLETVVQAEHIANIDGIVVIDRARKADDAGDIEGCNQALVEARRLFDLRN
jgi:hypothetical protein